MGKITALRQSKNKENRVNLYLDGKFAFSLEQVIANQEGLTVGLELPPDRLEELNKSLKITRCLNAAYRLLTFRPRSEAELQERLQKLNYADDQIEKVVVTLKEQGLINDAKFAEFWKDNRQTFSPRSRWLTGRELAKKGVAAEVIGEVVSGIDEEEAAYEAARPRAGRLAGYEYEEFRKKLGAYLQRRGFGFSVITRTVKRVWEEIKRKE